MQHKFDQNRVILDEAIKALEASAGLHVKAKKTNNPKADYDLFIEDPKQKGFLLVEIKAALTESALGQLFIQTMQTRQKWVLITHYVKPSHARILKELDIAYFDTVGNAFFNMPGLHVYIDTQRPRNDEPAYKHHRRSITDIQGFPMFEDPKKFRPSDLKILFALLSQPDLEAEDYRTIASRANVALGTIAWHMRRLKEGGFLPFEKEDKRHLINKKELFDLWVDGYIRRLRPKLLLARFESEIKTRWWNDVDLKQFDAYWGGEVAAEQLTGHLRSATVTIYAMDLLPRIQARFKLKRRSNGDIEILEKFWVGESEEPTAPPLIVYADLIASGDSRNIETAKMVYDKHIAQLIGEDS